MSTSPDDAFERESRLSQVTVRKMTDADIPHYCSQFKNVFSRAPWNEQWTIDKIGADIGRLMRKKGFFGMAAVTSQGNVGYLTGSRLRARPSIFYIDQLFVDVDHQGKRIGKTLLSETTRHLEKLGVREMVLLTKPKSNAEKFYVDNGYCRFLSGIRLKGKVFFHMKVRNHFKNGC